jgi:hypothetical protein
MAFLQFAIGREWSASLKLVEHVIKVSNFRVSVQPVYTKPGLSF